MLDVRLFQMQTFLPMPYEDALAPRLKLAHEKLQNGSGIGGDFTGWVHLPRDYGSRRRLPGSRAIPRPWWSSASAGPIWAPGA